MSFHADMIADRRRLRKQVSFWRLLAFGVAILAVLAIGAQVFRGGIGAGKPHVARIAITGLITGQQETIDLLRRAGRAQDAKAVILRINSGGGTTAGSETLYIEVRRLAEKKPVIAVIDGIGASGAYMTALGADRIIANGSAVVGSIGVIAQFPNVAKLLDTVGVKVEAIRSTPLKAMPNGLEATPPEARAALEATVMDTYRWFRGLVGERRGLDGSALESVADGRVFTGRQAIALKLIDALGDERDAQGWLADEKGMAKDLPVRTYAPPQRLSRFPGLALADLPQSLMGLLHGPEVEDVRRAVLGPGSLEGLVSVWQPARD